MVPAASTALSEPYPDASGRSGRLCRPVQPCSASVPSPSPPSPTPNCGLWARDESEGDRGLRGGWYRVLPSRVMMIKLD